jgi:hypothetical protein
LIFLTVSHTLQYVDALFAQRGNSNGNDLRILNENDSHFATHMFSCHTIRGRNPSTCKRGEKKEKGKGKKTHPFFREQVFFLCIPFFPSAYFLFNLFSHAPFQVLFVTQTDMHSRLFSLFSSCTFSRDGMLLQLCTTRTF